MTPKKTSMALFILTTWVACTVSPTPMTTTPSTPITTADPDMTNQTPTASLTLAVGDRVAYAGRFDWEDARMDNGRYIFTNDIGYTFRIDTLYLATSSVQLRPCEIKEASWLPRLGISVAYADHVVEDDPSIAFAGKTENAFDPQTQLLAVGDVDGGEYCQAFARSATLPEPENTLGAHTLVVSGAFTRDSASAQETWTPFDARIELTEGLLEDIHHDSTPTWQPNDDTIDASVVITRYPVRAFQYINPERLIAVELAWDVLGNLLHTSTIRFHKADRSEQ